jgi:hypothetical protein
VRIASALVALALTTTGCSRDGEEGRPAPSSGSTDAEALPQVIAGLRAAGYPLVTLPEVL